VRWIFNCGIVLLVDNAKLLSRSRLFCVPSDHIYRFLSRVRRQTQRASSAACRTSGICWSVRNKSRSNGTFLFIYLWLGLWGEATAVLLGIEYLTRCQSQITSWRTFGIVWVTTLVFFVQRIVALLTLAIQTTIGVVRVTTWSQVWQPGILMEFVALWTVFVINCAFFVGRFASTWRMTAQWRDWVAHSEERGVRTYAASRRQRRGHLQARLRN